MTILLAIIGCSVYAPVPTLNFPTLSTFRQDALLFIAETFLTEAPYPPVRHSAFAPAGTGWYDQVYLFCCAVISVRRLTCSMQINGVIYVRPKVYLYPIVMSY